MPRLTPFAPPAWQRALLLLAALLVAPGARAASDPIATALGLSNASLAVEEGGRLVIAHNADTPLIPASIMKLITALAAIDRLGLGYRFETPFYLAGDGRLWVKGSGDPYLVAEEFDLIARGLAAAGVRQVSGIGLDDSLFAADDRIPGRSLSSNPYDAPVTALAVNFNTVNVVVGNGGVSSAEAQTPLTPTARRLAAGLGSGTQRVNLQTRANALNNFGELLAAKLTAAGIRVGDGLDIGRVPAGARLVYTHRNTRTLEPMIRNMLEYSTNFVANSLFLVLGQQGGQTSMARSQQVVEAWARKRFGWSAVTIEDGAGLSRGNRVSARQMLDVLHGMAPNRQLLKAQDGNPAVRAKTGTLTGVSTYAGYVQRGGAWVPFALMINQPVDAGLRKRVASALASTPRLERP